MKAFLSKKLHDFLKRLRGEVTIEQLVKNGLTIGANLKVRPGCIIDYSHCWHIEIGDDVTLAPRVHILAHDASTKTHLNYTKIANVKIGNRVFIGAGSIILPGVNIGNDVIIGAGSIVSKSIPDNSLATGNPARVICSTTEYLDKQKLKMNQDNCFDESFTLDHGISESQKQHMKSITEDYCQSFVI
jgi:maltose O-acetyltransferase